jgi:hypothetical protein
MALFGSLRWRCRKLWLTAERYVVYNVIRLVRVRGQSERVARGFAAGLVVNFFPTFGFGVLISGAFARVLGGNVVAGVVGGATLNFVWPLLFYVNIRVGSLFLPSPIPVEDLDDVTETTMSALMWGKTFTVGALVNIVLVGLAVYLLLRLIYRSVRPATLRYFRRHAVDHQRRFRAQRELIGGATRGAGAAAGEDGAA